MVSDCVSVYYPNSAPPLPAGCSRSMNLACGRKEEYGGIRDDVTRGQ